MQKGKLIVFEGADGSGKTTQSKLLLSFLRGKKIPSSYISFPRYDRPWGKMVRRFLDGDFGEKVDPYLPSMLYAGDRASAGADLRSLMDAGKFIVCNRYTWSSAAHMGAKFSDSTGRNKYIKWLEELEFGENKNPREDLVVFLYVPVSVSKKLMKDRKLDILEKDLKYQKKVVEVYESISRRKKNWVKVDCSEGGKILSPSAIHQIVVKEVEKKLSL